MEKLEKQLREYYDKMLLSNYNDNSEFIKVRYNVYSQMDNYKREHPDSSAVALKSELHRCIAENFSPVLFDELPFFYEMGVKPSDCWGYPIPGLPSCWNFADRYSNIAKFDPDINSVSSIGCGENRLGWSVGHAFDTDHHVPGYSKLFEVGISGILKEISEQKVELQNKRTEKYDLLCSMEKSCYAVLRIAEKFSLSAEKQLERCTDKTKRHNLTVIRDTALRIPENPPQTFYEGICFIWFIREVIASLEGVGISSLGRLDKLLGKLYYKDISNGTLTREYAKRLIEMLMTVTHIKFDAANSSWADSSTGIELGGCDENGVPIFNEVTKIILEVHEEHKFIIPKLNCRISENSDNSDNEFIGLLSASILRGHNVYAVFNDSAVIKALVNNGFEERDACGYVNGGCQETTVEGSYCEGIWFYYNPVRIMDQTINGTDESVISVITDNTKKYLPLQIEKPNSFDDVYNAVLDNIKRAVKCCVDFRVKYGEKWFEVHPCPLFSSTLNGCIQNGRDYSAGGGKYNVATVCMTGIGTLTDSLYAIKKAVFEDKTISFEELRKALAENWETAPELRKAMIDMPKYGHGVPEVDDLVARIVKELNDYVKTLKNSRGGNCMLSFFSYSSIMYFGSYVGATPDGRLSGDYLSLGVSPGRLRAPACILDEIISIGNVDFRKTGGINVLDINLPFNKKMRPETVGALIKAFMKTGGHVIEFNYVSKDELIDATVNPDAHRDIIVRLYGLSEYFVNLGSDVQQEFITRNFCDE